MDIYRFFINNALFSCIIFLLVAQPAYSAERVALVIGNSAYRHAPHLANPAKDAHAIAKALSGLGFAVEPVLSDLDKSVFEGVLGDFRRKADQAQVAVVFYAGHGIESAGVNYLVPVDARLQDERDLKFEAVELDLVLAQIKGASQYRLVILDACRDNPLANRMRREDGTRAAFRGLERVEPVGATFVAYSARHGTQALDNSPFIVSLLKHIDQPLPLWNLFGAVRDDVLKMTDGRQEPWLYGVPTRDSLYLAPQPTQDTIEARMFAQKARAALKAGDAEMARLALELAAAADPSLSDLAAIEQRIGLLEQSQQAAEGHVQSAQEALASGDSDTAKKALEQATAADPSLSDLVELAQQISALEQRQSGAEQHVKTAQEALAAGAIDKAQNALKLAAIADPTLPDLAVIEQQIAAAEKASGLAAQASHSLRANDLASSSDNLQKAQATYKSLPLVAKLSDDLNNLVAQAKRAENRLAPKPDWAQCQRKLADADHNPGIIDGRPGSLPETSTIFRFLR